MGYGALNWVGKPMLRTPSQKLDSQAPEGQAALNATRSASPGFWASGSSVRLGHQILLLAGGWWIFGGPGRSSPPKRWGADAAFAASS